MEKSDEENQQQRIRNPMSMPPTPRGSDDPWLVFFHGKQGQYQTFYSISEGYNHVKNITCLRRKNICSCSHGWMVLSGTYSECFLLNPTTMEKIQLLPLDFQFKKCVLSSSPVDPSCIVLFISCPRDDIITFRFCSPKKEGTVDSWIKQEVKFEDAGMEDATSCDGKIYGFMDKVNEILVIEVVDTATLKVRKIEIEGCMPFFQEGPAHRVLVESCGKLYVVWKIYAEEYMPHEIQDFEVLKLDFSRKIWERVKSLGNRAFFVGPGCCTICFSASAKESESGIMGNTIYFTMAGDRSLYTYNLEEKSISVSLPCPNVQHNWSKPNWFLPFCSEE